MGIPRLHFLEATKYKKLSYHFILSFEKKKINMSFLNLLCDLNFFMCSPHVDHIFQKQLMIMNHVMLLTNPFIIIFHVKNRAGLINAPTSLCSKFLIFFPRHLLKPCSLSQKSLERSSCEPSLLLNLWHLIEKPLWKAYSLYDSNASSRELIFFTNHFWFISLLQPHHIQNQ